MILESWALFIEQFERERKNRMKAIAIIPLWFCLLSSSLAMPPVFLSYQDSIGQYSFGYSDPMSARSEYRASDGVTRGAYSYIDNRGHVQTAEYEAGKELGFRIRASNLPEAPLPVMDTPEVKEARDRHLQLLDEARMREDDDRSVARMDEDRPMVEPKRDEQPMMAMQEERKNEPTMAMQGERKDEVVPMIESKSADMLEEKKVTPEAKTAMEKESTDTPRKETMEAEMPKREEKAELALRMSGEPVALARSASPLPEPVKYTPEVMAAREAHFRAYEHAARLAAQADLSPELLEQLLRGHPGAVVTLPLSENKLDSDDSVDAKGSEESPALDQEATARRIDGPPKPTETNVEDKKMDTAAEKTLSLDMTKNVETPKLGSGLTPASTSLRVMDTRLPSLNEFQQSKLKAEITLTCETGLKVMEFDQVKPKADPRLLIINPVEFAPILSTDTLPKIQSPVAKNWAFQYVYL